MNRRPELGKVRLWCGTQFNLEFEWEKLVKEKVLTYVAYGLEACPKTGRMHHQFWCRFRNPRNSIKLTGKILGNANVRKIRGTLDENEEYCTKGGKNKIYVELGQKPQQGRNGKLVEIFREVKEERLPEVDIAEADPQLWCQYRRSIERYRKLCEENRTWRTDVRVFWGEAGTGKTVRAIDWLGGDYDEVSITQSGFIMGYNNNPCVLIDDFETTSVPRDLFLKMTDRYKMNINVKGSEAKWNPKKIAITSNTDPKEWYYQSTESVMRRLGKVEHYTEKFNWEKWNEEMEQKRP